MTSRDRSRSEVVDFAEAQRAKDASELVQPAADQPPRPSASIHYIYDPFNPSLNAIISVARRLQEVLIQHGGLPEGAPLPFPALAPAEPA